MTSAATSTLSRRAIFCVAPVILLGGCTSATEKEARRFLAVVHADPLFTWRPDWVTKDSTSESTAGLGVAAETRTRVSRHLNGGGMPSDAADIATAYAKSVGWLPESGGFHVRNVVMDGVEVRPSVNIFPSGASRLVIDFTD